MPLVGIMIIEALNEIEHVSFCPGYMLAIDSVTPNPATASIYSIYRLTSTLPIETVHLPKIRIYSNYEWALGHIVLLLANGHREEKVLVASYITHAFSYSCQN